MTKYRQAGDPEAERLQAVIDRVSHGIKARNYSSAGCWGQGPPPGDVGQHKLYLLGCARGIAIVEDKYRPELNPNVAMEWGWMAGLGRDGLFLLEKNFKHERADWKGLINYDFDWVSPAEGVQEALCAFLPARPPAINARDPVAIMNGDPHTRASECMDWHIPVGALHHRYERRAA